MKHLNEELRIIIWEMLEKGADIIQIALAIGKNRTTVMREILNHRSGDGNNECPLLASPPHVCNGCENMCRCRLGKWLYIPDKAQKEYRKTLINSRSGFNLSTEELAHIGDVLADGVSKGQSVFHVMTAHASEFTVCEKTVYSLINAGVISVSRHHLPEAPSRPLPLKLRKSKPRQHKVDRHCREGRTMDDFHAFIEENPSASVVEMDSVVGRAGGKVLLTLNMDLCGLMLAFPRERNDAKSVADIFDSLEEKLGRDMFSRIFGAVLTDNGSEFSDPVALEAEMDGVRRTRVFYCDPYCAWQKPCVENNHRNLRKVLPKGISFDTLTQETVNLVMSHVNSMLRKGYGNKSAAERFRLAFGKDVLDALGIKEIPASEVRLQPSLAGLRW